MAALQSIYVEAGSGSSGSDSMVHAEDYDSETARFTFDQIHQYLQFGTYPNHFQKPEGVWKIKSSATSQQGKEGFSRNENGRSNQGVLLLPFT